MNEEIELTERETEVVDKLSEMMELCCERFFIVVRREKERVEDIFEALIRLRDTDVKAVEVETRAGVVVIVDKEFNLSFCHDFVISDSPCRHLCSRIQ